MYKNLFFLTILILPNFSKSHYLRNQYDKENNIEKTSSNNKSDTIWISNLGNNYKKSL